MTNKDFVSGEDCPMGEACAIHYRNDERSILAEAQQGRLVNYVGKYVVITDGNNKFPDMPPVLVRLFGHPAYETSVTEVGDGALGDLYTRSFENEGLMVEMTRFVQEHDSWANFEDAHQTVVEGVLNGTIDLSKSYRHDVSK